MLATGRRPWDRADCARMLGWTISSLALMAFAVCPDGACPGVGPGSPTLRGAEHLTRFGRGTSFSSALPEQGRVDDEVHSGEGGGPVRIFRPLGGLYSWTSGIAPRWEGRRLLLRGASQWAGKRRGQGRKSTTCGTGRYFVRPSTCVPRRFTNQWSHISLVRDASQNSDFILSHSVLLKTV